MNIFFSLLDFFSVLLGGIVFISKSVRKLNLFESIKQIFLFSIGLLIHQDSDPVLTGQNRTKVRHLLPLSTHIFTISGSGLITFYYR